MAGRGGLLVAAILSLFAAGWSAGVTAAPITRSFEFTATGLVNQNFDPADFPPVDPVIGSVTLTFDPMRPAVVDQAAGILDFAINIAVASPVGFS